MQYNITEAGWKLFWDFMFCKYFIFLLILLSWPSSQLRGEWLAAPTSHGELQDIIQNNYQPEAPKFDLISQGLIQTQSRVLYLPIRWFAPGQIKYSFNKSLKKREKLFKSYGWLIRIEDLDNNPQLKQRVIGPDPDHFLGAYPEHKSFPAIVLKDRILLFDGTHRVMAALSSGATHMPIELREELYRPDMSFEEVAPLLQELFLIWPYRADGSFQPLPRFFDEMEAEPLIDWVSDHSLDINAKWSDSLNSLRLKVDDPQLDKRPLFVRIKQLPYPQLIISYLLRKAGFHLPQIPITSSEEEERLHHALIELGQAYLNEQLNQHKDIAQRRLPQKLILPEPVRVSQPSMAEIEKWSKSPPVTKACRSLIKQITDPFG